MTEEDLKDAISAEHADGWGGDDGLIDLHVIEDEIVGTVPLSRLSEFNPFRKVPWHDGVGFSKDGVETCLSAGNLHDQPYPGFSFSGENHWNSATHEARVAYLVKNPSDTPISLEFTDPYQETLEVDDGWHRLAAALIRGDKDIRIAVGGYFKHSVIRLGAICREYNYIAEALTFEP